MVDSANKQSNLTVIAVLLEEPPWVLFLCLYLAGVNPAVPNLFILLYQFLIEVYNL